MHGIADKRLATFIALSVLAHLALFVVSQSSLRVPAPATALTLSGMVTVQFASDTPGQPHQKNNSDHEKRDAREPYRTTIAKTGSQPAPPKVTDHHESASKDDSVNASNDKRKTILSELQRLLLAEINLHKHYPLSALRMGQQGTARVGFRLRKNGYIDALAVLRSSGHESLDRAALSAINDIQPFTPADRLLTKAADMQIDIVFQL
jgi:protein TonB